jgi:hypothetical protein
MEFRDRTRSPERERERERERSRVEPGLPAQLREDVH